MTIGGFNLAAVTSVAFNGKAGTITGYSANQIQAYPPSDSGIGPIKVSTATASFTTGNNFTNAAAPIITDFSPVLGPVGSMVTIDGINFTGVTSVKFGNTRRLRDSCKRHPVFRDRSHRRQHRPDFDNRQFHHLTRQAAISP